MAQDPNAEKDWSLRIATGQNPVRRIALERTPVRLRDYTVQGLNGETNLAALKGMCVLIAAQVGNQYYPWGTGVLIAPGIVLTAKHVYSEFGRIASNGSVDGLIAIAPDESALKVWITKQVYRLGDADLALLFVEPGWTSGDAEEKFFIPSVKLTVPCIGDQVLLFGFRSTDDELPLNESTVEFKASALYSAGHVTERYPSGRDRSILPGSCVEVNATSIGGMSGGPAFDVDGNLVGILSTSIAFADGCSSFVSLLSPALNRRISPHWPPHYWGQEAKLIDQRMPPDQRLFLHFGDDIHYDGADISLTPRAVR